MFYKVPTLVIFQIKNFFSESWFISCLKKTFVFRKILEITTHHGSLCITVSCLFSLSLECKMSEGTVLNQNSIRAYISSEVSYGLFFLRMDGPTISNLTYFWCLFSFLLYIGQSKMKEKEKKPTKINKQKTKKILKTDQPNITKKNKSKSYKQT